MFRDVRAPRKNGEDTEIRSKAGNPNLTLKAGQSLTYEPKTLRVIIMNFGGKRGERNLTEANENIVKENITYGKWYQKY